MNAIKEKRPKERRSLVEGLEPTSSVNRIAEEQFVFARTPKPSQLTTPEPTAVQVQKTNAQPTTAAARTPITTRIRTDYASALKRASLERQLSGTVPHTLQDILEQALEPWLRSNGYLT